VTTRGRKCGRTKRTLPTRNTASAGWKSRTPYPRPSRGCVSSHSGRRASARCRPLRPRRRTPSLLSAAPPSLHPSDRLLSASILLNQERQSMHVDRESLGVGASRLHARQIAGR
jgi:hypothetical protein